MMRRAALTLITYFIPFLLIFSISLLQNVFLKANLRVLHGTDLEVPPESFHQYLQNMLAPYTPQHFGCEKFLHLYEILYGVLMVIVGNNRALAQYAIIALPPLVSYLSMLFLLTKVLGIKSRVASIIGSLLYAFSPIYLAWFTQPYMIGYALLPLHLAILTKALKHIMSSCAYRNTINIRYLIVLSLLLAVITGWIVSLLHQIIVNLLIFEGLYSITYMLIFSTSLRKKYSKSIRLGKLLFCILMVYAIVIAVLLTTPRMLTTIFVSGKAVLQTSIRNEIVNINLIRLYYADSNFLNTIILNSLTPFVRAHKIYSENMYFGIILIILTILPLILVKRWKDKYTNEQLSLMITVFVVWLVLIAVIVNVPRLSALLLNGRDAENIPGLLPYYFISVNRRPERLTMVLTLFESILISYSINNLCSAFCKLKKRDQEKPFTSRRLVTKMVYFILILTFLATYSAYTRLYSKELYSYHYITRPKVYDSLEEFLKNNVHREFLSPRYIILPMYMQAMASERYNFPSIGYASMYYNTPRSIAFYRLLQEAIVNSTTYLPWLLESSGIKYVLVLNKTNLLEHEFANWRFLGRAQVSGMYIFGNPEALLSNVLKALSYSNRSYSIENYAEKFEIVTINTTPTLLYTPCRFLIFNDQKFNSTYPKTVRTLISISDAISRYYGAHIPALLMGNTEITTFLRILGTDINDLKSLIGVFVDCSKGNIYGLYNASYTLSFEKTYIKLNGADILKKIKIWSEYYSVDVYDGDLHVYIAPIHFSSMRHVSIWIDVSNMNLRLNDLNKLIFNLKVLNGRILFFRIVLWNGKELYLRNPPIVGRAITVYEFNNYREIIKSYKNELIKLLAFTITPEDKYKGVEILLRNLTLVVIKNVALNVNDSNSTKTLYLAIFSYPYGIRYSIFNDTKVVIEGVPQKIFVVKIVPLNISTSIACERAIRISSSKTIDEIELQFTHHTDKGRQSKNLYLIPIVFLYEAGGGWYVSKPEKLRSLIFTGYANLYAHYWIIISKEPVSAVTLKFNSLKLFLYRVYIFYLFVLYIAFPLIFVSYRFIQEFRRSG